MRLISRKLWRAFPELDQYDDEVCKRYIARARQVRGSEVYVLTMVAVILCSLILAILSTNVHYHALIWLADRLKTGYQIGAFSETFVELLVFVSLIWVPALSGFITRDFLLRRCVRQHLSGAICHGCRYSLIGLDIFDLQGETHVLCPECGEKVNLARNNLSEADVNPQLLECS
jgi:hypothetical protein